MPDYTKIAMINTARRGAYRLLDLSAGQSIALAAAATRADVTIELDGGGVNEVYMGFASGVYPYRFGAVGPIQVEVHRDDGPTTLYFAAVSGAFAGGDAVRVQEYEGDKPNA